MTAVLLKITALCMLASLAEQLTSGSRFRDSVRLICGILAARLVLEAILALPGALSPQ